MQPDRAREPVLRMAHLVVILETLKQSDSPKPSSGSSPQSIENPCRALRKEPHLPPEIQKQRLFGPGRMRDSKPDAQAMPKLS